MTAEPGFPADLTATIAAARRHALGDLLARTAARTPDRPALIWRDETATYAELDNVVNRTANALAARGVRRATASPCSRTTAVSSSSSTSRSAKLGAISVPINFMLNADEVAFILDHSGASGVVAEDALGSRDHAGDRDSRR